MADMTSKCVERRFGRKPINYSILCESCAYWVDCDSPSSFCLVEDLFTPTARTECPNWEKGVPITEEEWEKAQEGCLD